MMDKITRKGLFSQACRRVSQIYQGTTTLIDKWTPHKKCRWAGSLVLLLLFMLRIIAKQGLYIYIVAYILGVFLLNRFDNFQKLKKDPYMDFDGEEKSGPALPTSRPVIPRRRPQEFKFWLSVTTSTLVAFCCTFIETFNMQSVPDPDVPVFWPMVMVYIFMVFLTIMELVIKSKSTVVPANPFDPRKDAAVLRKAMKGFCTDESAIIQVLTKRSNDQRLRIASEFKTLYGKDLVSDLKNETGGKFKDLLVALMTPLPKFYAKELHDAISGIGTDEDVLIEVMWTLSNCEIQVIKQAYTAMYGTLLEDDLRGDTSGNIKRLMISLCMGNRSEKFRVDQEKAREDARSLLQAGELRLGTDESMLNAVLCSRSFPQLAAIFQEYQDLTGHDIDDAIRAEFSGDLEKVLRAIVKVVRNKPLFFAERFHKSMKKGLGTNDRQLIRIMVTRCEVDLGAIDDMFNSKYGESLESWIERDCSGHSKECLLGLLGFNE